MNGDSEIFSEPASALQDLVRAEWDGMYADVIKDLGLAAARIPEDKLTRELFCRIVRREQALRLRLAESWDDEDPFNRVCAAMLDIIEADPDAHLAALQKALPGVRADIVKQGGFRYAQGQDALSRRETELAQQALQVDHSWDPID